MKGEPLRILVTRKCGELPHSKIAKGAILEWGTRHPLDFSMLESRFCLGFFRMPDANARQKAEDLYYSALDLMAEGNLLQAVGVYKESLQADPTFTEAMHGLARALQDLGHFDEAIDVAKRISEIDPDDVLAHTSLSVLYQKKGMIPEAEAEGAKARVLGWKQQLKGRG